MHIIQKLKNITDRRLALESTIMGMVLGTVASIWLYSFLKPPVIQRQPPKQPTFPAASTLIEDEIAAIQKNGTKSRKVFDWINSQKLDRIAIYKTDSKIYIAVPPKRFFKPSATLVACDFNPYANAPVLFSAPITYDGNKYKIEKGTYKFGQLEKLCQQVIIDELRIFYEQGPAISAKYIQIPYSINFQ